MKGHKTLPLLAALAVTACGAEDITPLEGDWYWNIGKSTLAEDSCGRYELGMSDDSDAQYLLSLTMAEDGAVELIDEDGVSLTCETDDGGAYACAPSSSTQDLSKKDFDAVFSVTTALSFVLESSSKGTMSMRTDYGCEGEDCDAVSSEASLPFPCFEIWESGFYTSE